MAARRPAVPSHVTPRASVAHVAHVAPPPARALPGLHLRPLGLQPASQSTPADSPDSSGGGGSAGDGYPTADTSGTSTDDGSATDDTGSDETSTDAAPPEAPVAPEAPAVAVSAPTLPAPTSAVSLYEIVGAAIGGAAGYWGLGALLTGPVGLIVGVAAGALAGHVARGKGQANATT